MYFYCASYTEIANYKTLPSCDRRRIIADRCTIDVQIADPTPSSIDGQGLYRKVSLQHHAMMTAGCTEIGPYIISP